VKQVGAKRLCNKLNYIWEMINICTMRQLLTTWQKCKKSIFRFSIAFYFYGCSQIRSQKLVTKFEIYARNGQGYDASDVSAEQVTGDLFGKPIAHADEPCSSSELRPECTTAAGTSTWGTSFHLVWKQCHEDFQYSILILNWNLFTSIMCQSLFQCILISWSRWFSTHE
jgi:hypothetical protein